MGLIALAGLAAAVVAVKPVAARTVGLDTEMSNAAALARHLDDELGDVLERKAEKRAVAADLIAGRTTLTEASYTFLAIDSRAPDRMAVVRRGLPGRTDVEREARSVVRHVLAQIPRADEHERARARLEADLARLVESGSAGLNRTAGGGPTS